MKHLMDEDSAGEHKGISRRRFVKVIGISALGVSSLKHFNFKTRGVSIVVDPSDAIATSGPSVWAVDELEQSLKSEGIDVFRCEQISETKSGDLIIVAAGSDSSIARRLLKDSKEEIPAVPEALGMIPVSSAGRQVLLACGYDTRGLVYAILEIADRVHYSNHPLHSLNIQKAVVERPANVIRSVTRLFVSEIEDKPWFYDREMWKKYLTMLTTQRFNRFSLSLGIGYDFLQNVTDAYFLFAYPFFLSVPGYNVRVPQLPDAERDKNLETLKYISDEAAARGLEFQLGIWMHGYKWNDSPDANYTIEGLTHETHGPYCRDALRRILQECPNIGGITFRIHGESGVKEGSYGFWKTVFDGVATCGRKVEIDMHAKGITQEIIDIALATGMPVKVSPKYWAEHLGLPYQQTDIRAFEIPKPGEKAEGLLNLSAGSRSFTRYGYADLLKEDRRYEVMFRIWPGTQRVLLWGNPEMSAAYSKTFGFCGCVGVELMEPLSFKGRRGSGIAGGRCAYLDKTLNPKWDWEKYLYSYRVFGRLAYEPDAQPDVWRRYLTRQFGDGTSAVESTLANAFPILPIVLTAHGVSAANNLYWPEVYTNFSIADPNNKNPYFDTPSPKVFGNVSPMDPQLFMGINEFADELLKGKRSGKYSPIEYAQWVEDFADETTKYLEQAKIKSRATRKPEFRRMDIDAVIASGLGRFFGAKFRSGVLFAIFKQSGDREALELSIQYYHKAKNFWIELADSAKDVYERDITYGGEDFLRGHWLDRLPAIDEDIDFMRNILKQTPVSDSAQPENVRLAIQEALGRPKRTFVKCLHSQPDHFNAGQPLDVELSVERPVGSVRLYYRHVTQAERFKSVEMDQSGKSFRATIPAEYTETLYPLQYYFELRDTPENAWLYPGLTPKLTQEPYYVVRKA
ncbi:MAG: hypothetical protein M1378_11555 [Bacteroidetes bacterium]|nr:hypothetical protein [Bacteroidota bacterium]